MPDPVDPPPAPPAPAPPAPAPPAPAPPAPAPKSSRTLQGWIDGAIVLIIFVVIGWALYEKGGFLKGLQEIPVARGLITFLIVITTMGIAIMLAYSTLFGETAPGDDKTFDKGKQVLTVLIGLMGTIVGFYFGSPDKGVQPQTQGLTLAPAHVSNVHPKKGETFTLSDFAYDGKPPYTFAIKFDPPIPEIKDIKSESGVLEQKITVPDTLTSDTDVKYQIHVTDSDNKSADKDGPQKISLKTK